MNKNTSINGILLTTQNDFSRHVKDDTVHVTEEERTAWNAQTTVNAKGIIIATQEDLDGHSSDAAIHITETERTVWNAKAEASEVNAKTDREAFDAHTGNTTAHVTAEERRRWNATPELDESGSMALPGGLTTEGTYNAKGGINIPVAPVRDTDAVRLSDLSHPLFLPQGNTPNTIGRNLFVRNGRPTTYFGHLVNLDDPVLILQNCVQQGDNTSGYMYGEQTFVLDLCAYRIEDPNGNSRNTRPQGVHCQWGIIYNANPGSVTNRPPNRYDTALARADGWRNYSGGSAMVWPASTGGDGKQRCGFVAGFRDDLLNGRNLEYLYAVMQPDWVRMILYKPGYNDNRGSLELKQWCNNYYLFVQDLEGNYHYIGYANNNGWADYALAMSNHGRDGILGMQLYDGDVFALRDKCVCIYDGPSVKTRGRYPLSQSLFKPTSEAQNLSVIITLEDKTCQVTSHPDWMTVTLTEDAEITLSLTANNANIERLGLVDLKMSNGLTYTIVIYQQA